jgi:hypothetical protein
MMGKNDSEARKLRELSNGGDRARFLFHRSWGRTAKNSLLHLAWGRWRETWRRGEELALALAMAWPAGACPLGDGSSEQGGRLRFAGENNEGGRERNGRGGEGVTGNRGLEGNGVGTPSQAAGGREGARGGGQLLEREDMFWGVQQFCEEVCLGFVLVSRKFLSFCKIKTTHLEMVKNHETF